MCAEIKTFPFLHLLLRADKKSCREDYQRDSHESLSTGDETLHDKFSSTCWVCGSYPKISRTLSTRPLSSRSLFSTAASCSSSFRCSLVNEVGVTTLTDTNRSPRPRPPKTGIPFPFKRKTVPV